MRKIFTLAVFLTLCQFCANAQNYVTVYEGDSLVVDVLFSQLDSVTIRDKNYYGSEWSLYGTGTYTYSLFFQGPDVQEVYKRQPGQNPDALQFKMTHWGMDVDLIIDYDASTGQCTVQPQKIGYADATYGDVYVSEISLYESTFKERSTYNPQTGLFNLQVIYYVPNVGYFNFGVETLQIDISSVKAVKRQVKRPDFKLQQKTLNPRSCISVKQKPTGDADKRMQLRQNTGSEIVE